ncbi:MAG: hypothetical protein K0S28_307 [Paucimonas sp.]|jgi:OOP family OmpA-OmpF porin|nr:hypothetical protein [Paucimonas sp.]
MKKVLLCALLSGATLSPLAANAEGGYVDIGVGQSRYTYDNDDFNLTSGDDNPTAYSIAAGTRLNQIFGAEIGYTDLGEIDQNYTYAGGTLSTGIQTRALHLAGTATASLSDEFSVFGKLGVTRNRTKGTANSATLNVNDSVNKTGWLAGVGAAYHFTPALAGTVGYDYFDRAVDNDTHIGKWSLGLRMGF